MVGQMATRNHAATSGGCLGTACKGEREREGDRMRKILFKEHIRILLFYYKSDSCSLTEVCEFLFLSFPDRINFCKLKKSALSALYVHITNAHRSPFFGGIFSFQCQFLAQPNFFADRELNNHSLSLSAVPGSLVCSGASRIHMHFCASANRTACSAAHVLCSRNSLKIFVNNKTWPDEVNVLKVELKNRRKCNAKLNFRTRSVRLEPKL